MMMVAFGVISYLISKTKGNKKGNKIQGDKKMLMAVMVNKC